MMKTIYLLLLTATVGFCNCKKDPVQVQELIPLDGRGGGIIAYCFQPVDGSGLHQLYGINADGTGNVLLINSTIGLNHCDWSPDGQKIAAVGYSDNNNTWAIYLFNADGSNLSRLTDETNVWYSEPAWSPDGSEIAFTRIYPDESMREELWIMDADGENQKYIGVEGFAAKWSADGTRFIYSSKSSGNYEIYTCLVDGSNVLKLTNSVGFETFPIWSPDNLQIAYQIYPEGDYNSSEIHIMNYDGSDDRVLISADITGFYPRWSPDGSSIVFYSGAFKEWEIYTVNTDGTNLKQVTDLPSGKTAINPVWKPEFN